MPSIDPRLAQLPKELQTSFGVRVYFEELERFLHDVWQNLGGGTSTIEELQAEDNGVILALSNARKISELESYEALQQCRNKNQELEAIIPLLLGKISQLENRINNIETEL